MPREDQNQNRGVNIIRPCRDDDRDAMLAIINAAAEAYRGVIPADRWHEPYMPLDELDSEITAGVTFWGYAADGVLAGVMCRSQIFVADVPAGLDGRRRTEAKREVRVGRLCGSNAQHHRQEPSYEYARVAHAAVTHLRQRPRQRDKPQRSARPAHT